MLPTKFQYIWLSDFRGEDLFRNQPIRNKNCLWWPCLIKHDEMSNLKRIFHICFLPSFGSFSQAVPEEKIKIWWPCLLTDRDEMSIFYRGPPIEASYQVLVHLAKRFQRRRLKYEKLTDDGRQVMAKAHIALIALFLLNLVTT